MVCEHLDTVPMWLDAVWNDEIDAELTLERFTKYWRFGAKIGWGCRPERAHEAEEDALSLARTVKAAS